MEIESARPDDVDWLVDAWIHLAGEQREYGSQVRVESNRETMRPVLASHQTNDTALVARLDGERVGFATYSVERGPIEMSCVRALLSNLWVDPDHRNLGVGTALLRAVETDLEDHGVESCRLEVLSSNDSARRFYRKNGYEPQRVTMRRSLDGGDGNDTHTKDDR